MELEQFEAYLLEDEKAENTIACYKYAVESFYDIFPEVNKKNMIEYKKIMLEKRSPKTAANRCIAMNKYCDFLGKPECKVKGVKIHKQNNVENVITLEEYQYFLECLKRDEKEKIYFIVKFLACTGARVSELLRLEKSCLETGEAVLWTKGKIRKILIPKSLIKEGKTYFERVEGKYIFPNRNGKMMTSRGVAEIIKRNGIKYGIRKEVLHPHSFRHLFAIQFLNNNKNIALLADLMGHESVDTTAIYLRLSADEQKRQFETSVNW